MRMIIPLIKGANFVEWIFKIMFLAGGISKIIRNLENEEFSPRGGKLISPRNISPELPSGVGGCPSKNDELP